MTATVPAATRPTDTELEAPGQTERGWSSAPADVELRVAVERFEDVPSAERSACRLANAGVPEAAMHLCAQGVHSARAARCESHGQAAGEGLKRGAVFGALFGFLWFAVGYAGGGAVPIGAGLGALAGVLVAVALHHLELRSDQGVVLEAVFFDLLVDEPHAERAADELHGAGERG